MQLDQQTRCDYVIIVEMAVPFQNGFKWLHKRLIRNVNKPNGKWCILLFIQHHTFESYCCCKCLHVPNIRLQIVGSFVDRFRYKLENCHFIDWCNKKIIQCKTSGNITLTRFWISILLLIQWCKSVFYCDTVSYLLYWYFFGVYMWTRAVNTLLFL